MITVKEIDETEKAEQGLGWPIEKIADGKGDCAIEGLPKIFDKGDPWY